MSENENTIQNENQEVSEPRNYGNLESDILTKEEDEFQDPNEEKDELGISSDKDVEEEHLSNPTPIKDFKKDEVPKSQEVKKEPEIGKFLSSAINKLPEQDKKKLYDTINSYVQNQLPMETFLSAIANKIEQLLINRKIV